MRIWRLVLILLPLGGLGLLGCGPVGQAPSTAPSGYLLCFWNVENFFDDRLDGWKQPDKAYDEWFANGKEALAKKIENLCKVLLGMNNGRGPDIIGLAELESYWSAELLQKALNQRLRNEADHYQTVLYKDPAGGRSIACVVMDEVAFWRSETTANLDVETYQALVPSLATIPGAMLIGISTPYRRAGLLYQKWKDYFGVADDDVLVVHGASRAFNPTLPQ